MKAKILFYERSSTSGCHLERFHVTMVCMILRADYDFEIKSIFGFHFRQLHYIWISFLEGKGREGKERKGK